MVAKIHAVDRFFLSHATNRADRALASARRGVNNLADEFATLAERTPIPEHLRERYGRVADILETLRTILEGAEKETLQILRQTEGEVPLSELAKAPSRASRAAILHAGETLNTAEAKAREMLRSIQPELTSAPWSKGRAHVEARFVVYLDPGPDFPHYLLDDTDFNLFEEPSSFLSTGELVSWLEDGGTQPRPSSGPLVDLELHGHWLHALLSRSCLEWEHFGMIQTVYVDFDLGAGIEVPGK